MWLPYVFHKSNKMSPIILLLFNSFDLYDDIFIVLSSVTNLQLDFVLWWVHTSKWGNFPI